ARARRPARAPGNHPGDPRDRGLHHRQARPGRRGGARRGTVDRHKPPPRPDPAPPRRPGTPGHARASDGMTRRQFEALVDRALRRLPRKFKDKLANIAVVVEAWPEDSTLAELGIEPPDTLYGLYRGVDLTRRDSSYGNVLPD